MINKECMKVLKLKVDGVQSGEEKKLKGKKDTKQQLAEWQTNVKQKGIWGGVKDGDSRGRSREDLLFLIIWKQKRNCDI